MILASIFLTLCLNFVTGTLDWSSEITIPVVDTCLNMTERNGAQMESKMFRCSGNSVYEFEYVGSEDCTLDHTDNGDQVSVTVYGGCTESSSMYKVLNCSDAQLGANTTGDCAYATYLRDTSGSAPVHVPLHQCLLDGASSSTRYDCVDGTVNELNWDNADCFGTEEDNEAVASKYSADLIFNGCDGEQNFCSPKVYYYTHSEYCGYEDHENQAGDNEECNYLLASDGAVPIALDSCSTNRRGYYEWSYQYQCDDAGENVELIYYLDDADCSDDSTQYVVAYYTNNNYTFECNQQSCSSYLETSYTDCDFKNYYSSSPVAWNQCLRYVLDPNSQYSDNVYNDYRYVKDGCLYDNDDEGYLVRSRFYYFDSDCEDSEGTVFTRSASASVQTNDDESECATYTVSGCRTNAKQYKNDANHLKYFVGILIGSVAVFIN